MGGPGALDDTGHFLREVLFAVRVLDWHAHDPKGTRPERIPLPEYAHEKRAQQQQLNRKADAWQRRQAARAAAG